MQSHIKLKLKFKCIIGILDFERKKKQKIIVKIRAKSDEFLDYAELAKNIKNTYKKHKFYTIEESLEILAAELKQKFSSLYYIKIHTFKPEILKNTKAGACFQKKF